MPGQSSHQQQRAPSKFQELLLSGRYCCPSGGHNYPRNYLGEEQVGGFFGLWVGVVCLGGFFFFWVQFLDFFLKVISAER